MRDNLYTFGFAAVICIICSLLLSFCAEALRPLQERKERVDVHRNILMAVGIPEDPHTKLGDAEVEKEFNEKLRPIVIDESGNIVEGMKPEDLVLQGITDKYTVYLFEVDGEIKAYVIPMKGLGLWGPISGYMAIAPDLNEVKGVTFFAPKETPGLGAEIVKAWFKDQFKGKKIRNEEGELVSVEVVKGHAEDAAPDRLEHAVDGVSGATITGNGVSKMIEDWLNKYEPYFTAIRKGNTA